MSFMLLACGDSKDQVGEIDRLEGKVEDLEGRLGELDAGFQDVMEALHHLGFEIEDFRRENWQMNVPDVEDHFEELKRVASLLEEKF